MRKFLLIIAQLFLIITAFAQTYKYASTNLNLRTGPGTSYEVLATIPADASVRLTENCVCDWIRVYYNGKTGYVSTKYLTGRQLAGDQKSSEQSRQKSTGSTVKHYTNTAGQRVQSPTRYNSPPAGATALCRDGTYSFSRNRRGTCSHHGGVAEWL